MWHADRTVTLRIGLIGVGSMGLNHARVLSDMEDVVLVAVADPDRAALAHVARRSAARAYTDHRAMLGAEQLDAAVIVSSLLRGEPGETNAGDALATLEIASHILSSAASSQVVSLQPSALPWPSPDRLPSSEP